MKNSLFTTSTGRHAVRDRQGVLDAWAKSKACRSRPVIGKASLDERAEDRPPWATGRAQGEIELQPVFVSNCGISRKTLVTVNRYQREPRSQTKGDAALNEVLEQVGRSLVEPLVEFDIQRLIRPKGRWKFPDRARALSASHLRDLRAVVVAAPSPRSRQSNCTGAPKHRLCVASPSLDLEPRVPPKRMIPPFVGTELSCPCRFSLFRIEFQEGYAHVLRRNSALGTVAENVAGAGLEALGSLETICEQSAENNSESKQGEIGQNHRSEVISPLL